MPWLKCIFKIKLWEVIVMMVGGSSRPTWAALIYNLSFQVYLVWNITIKASSQLLPFEDYNVVRYWNSNAIWLSKPHLYCPHWPIIICHMSLFALCFVIPSLICGHDCMNIFLFTHPLVNLYKTFCFLCMLKNYYLLLIFFKINFLHFLT